jgi:acetyl esterase/lipase
MLRLLAFCLLLLVPLTARAEDTATFVRTRDVIYGRKFGLALTMDIFKPKQNANGAAVVVMVSGGFFSAPEMINPGFCQEFLKRGYTVFCVVHGSQPRFTVDEILQDAHRAIRFIRHHAQANGIDPNRIGVCGASAGGHLSLMLGTAGGPGDPKAADPIDRLSSKVQAVACFFPPTDFLNFGKSGQELLGAPLHDKRFRASFEHRVFDREKGLYVVVTDPEKLRAITREISPITHVSSETAPTLILHGDKDDIVPFQQAEVFVAKMKEKGVPVELVLRPGAGHGWPTIANDFKLLADWFDKYLAAPPATGK